MVLTKLLLPLFLKAGYWDKQSITSHRLYCILILFTKKKDMQGNFTILNASSVKERSLQLYWVGPSLDHSLDIPFCVGFLYKLF